MTQTTVDIEQVVREVLRELQLATAQTAAAPRAAIRLKTASSIDATSAADRPQTV